MTAFRTTRTAKFSNNRQIVIGHRRLSPALLLGVLILVVSVMPACSTSIRSLDKDKELAKADKMIGLFHELFNASRFEEIYGLLDDSVRPSVDKEEFLVALKQTFEKWGRVEDSNVSEAKVFWGNPVQVRAIYNVRFENGLGQEWYTCNIRGEDARLVEYTTAPGFDEPKK